MTRCVAAIWVVAIVVKMCVAGCSLEVPGQRLGSVHCESHARSGGAEMCAPKAQPAPDGLRTVFLDEENLELLMSLDPGDFLICRDWGRRSHYWTCVRWEVQE